MFPQIKKRNNESGIILFIVLMTAIIIMIFSVGILTQSMNESNYAQQQIDQIISDELVKGIFWNGYSNGALASAQSIVGAPLPLQNRPYTTTLANSSVINGSLNGTTSFNVTTNFDTFQ
jgi:hypothetical protein